MRAFDSTAPGGSHPQVAVRPERFGALAYHFGTRRLSVSEEPRAARRGQVLEAHPSARDACRAAGVADDEMPRYERALATLADTGMIVPRDGVDEPSRAGPMRLVDHFETGLDAPICLTWELTYACNLACVHCLSSSGPARPARAEHRRMQGGDRRARADAGVLCEHRRRRADGPARLLGACRLRGRAPRRREVLDQRQSRITPAVASRLAAHRLCRRADLARRRHRRGQ